LEVIRERPKDIAAAIGSGFTEEKAKEAAEYFREHVGREILFRDLSELGLTKRQQNQAIEKFGARAAELIRSNPFRLMLIRGIGFLRADKLYLDLGGDPFSEQRIGWCAWNALHRDRTGSTWIELRSIVSSVSHTIQTDDIGVKLAIEWAIEHGHIVSAGSFIGEKTRVGAEKRLAESVLEAVLEGENE
jgi:hypothetical protein